MPKDPPLAFPTEVGTTWVYEGTRGKLTIVISETKEEKDGSKLVTTEYVLDKNKRKPHMVWRVSARGVFLVAESGEKYEEPWCLIIFPHREGQTWENPVKRPGINFITSMRAGPFEKVRVPAGEFDAARVEWSFRKGQYNYTSWYAHGIGLVRMDEDMKLQSFIPGKQ
jgi:hypothetical protein